MIKPQIHISIYMYTSMIIQFKQVPHHLPQSAGAVEYTDCFSAEEYDSPNKCPGYDTKQSDDEAPGMRSTPSLPSLPGPLWPSGST